MIRDEKTLKRVKSKLKIIKWIKESNVEKLLKRIESAEQAEKEYSNKWITLQSLPWGDIEVFLSKKESFKQAFQNMVNTRLDIVEDIHQACNKIPEGRNFFIVGINSEEIDTWKALVLQAKAELNKAHIDKKLMHDIPLTDEEYQDFKKLYIQGEGENL